MDCDEEYIGESSRTFGERFKEHLKAPSPIYYHYNTTGHNVTIENFSIVEREDQNLCRWIKEALYIRVNNPSLNKNIGKYHLPHIWDEVLHNTPELKLKWILSCHLPPLGTTSTREAHTLQWLFHLPLGNNISHHINIIPSKWLFHLPSGNSISQYYSCNILKHNKKMATASAIKTKWQ